MAQTVAPRNEERPFEFDELFFSTTNWRGVIESGNEVFVRVAGYADIGELVGRPHSVIRHPHMPRVVFKLLWDYLGAGRGIAAYVKNLATDGRYYWVMALAVPTSAGYLSVRFKPSTAYFDLIRGLYPELLDIEAAHGDRTEGMDAAQARLLEAVRAAGFLGYDDFMQTALAAEMAARHGHLTAHRKADPPLFLLPPDRDPQAGPSLRGTLHTVRRAEGQLQDLFSHAETFLELIKKLDGRSVFLRKLSRKIQLLSMNALIASCQMQDAGRGLAVVTDNLAWFSREGNAAIAEMTRGMSTLSTTLRETSFTVTAAKLQAEMSILFAEELLRTEGAVDEARRRRTLLDLDILVASFTQSTTRMLASLPANRKPIQDLLREGNRLSEAVMMLLSVHVIGRVEAAQVSQNGHFQTLFDEVLLQLQAAQNEMRDFSANLAYLTRHMPRFDRASRDVQEALDELAPPAARAA